MSDSTPPLEGLDKYKAAFGLLAEDGQDKIKVSKFLEFVKAAFGEAYDDDTIHVLSQGLGPDENGLVDFDNFMKLFSGDRLCPEAKQEVCKAFAQSPDLCGLADWSGALAKLGLSLSKEDVDKVMQQAVKSAVELLKQDFKTSNNDDDDDDSGEDESGDEADEGLEKALEKLHLGDSADEKDENTAGDPATSPTSSKIEPAEAPVEEPASAVDK